MKTKSILIIAGTLAIGFIIGFLTNGYLTRQKFQNFVEQGSHDAFKYRMMEIIRPTESQAREIEPILDQFAQEAHNSIEASKGKMKELHGELMEELKPFLNEVQLERLERANSRFQRVWDKRGGPPGPMHHEGRRGKGPGRGLDPKPGN